MNELFRLSGFGFTYPQQRRPALTGVDLTIRSGEFWVLCGPSGCGKSTLLRQLKTVLTPHGVTEGGVYFQGTPLRDVPLRQQAADIGFVLQSPEHQVVTDKVWHELAFGLESLGCDTPSIRRRVAEMASFFGIQDWFHKSVDELSGGQKQLLSLASVMVMQPKVLILDEPTSQLDPIAAADFLQTLGRINRELIRWGRHYNQAVRALNTIAMFVRNKGGIDPQVAKEQLTKAASELELVQGSVEEIKEMVQAVHESERFWR